jgi:cathepsin X
MMMEVMRRGPISCTMTMSTALMNDYKGGIFSEATRTKSAAADPAAPAPAANHTVAVSGWGYDGANNRSYWIARGNFGTWWGEGGWFRIQMHSGNLGIEKDCAWAVPDLPV